MELENKRVKALLVANWSANHHQYICLSLLCMNLFTRGEKEIKILGFVNEFFLCLWNSIIFQFFCRFKKFAVGFVTHSSFVNHQVM